MTFEEYQELAERTARGLDYNDRLGNFGMGISGEAGEVCDYLKKVLYHGHDLNKDILIKELGDVMWYVSTIANTIDISLEEVAKHNIEKLKKRYPKGFNSVNSIERGE